MSEVAIRKVNALVQKNNTSFTLVIPKSMVKAMGLKGGDSVIVKRKRKTLIIQKLDYG